MRRIFLLAALAASAGCAALASADRAPEPEAQLAAGLAALEHGEYSRARSHLGWVYSNHWDEPAGRQALLALIAADLDPRNPDRRLANAAELAARLVTGDEAPAWTSPLGESLYLIALELGAHDPPATADSLGADSIPLDTLALLVDAAPLDPRLARLPTLDGLSLPARLAAVRTERDSLAARIGALESALAEREKAIREKDEELERIRKIIRG